MIDKKLPAHIPFNPAHPNRFKVVAPGRPWDLIVIHDMEVPEKAVIAQNIASWFHNSSTPQTSAHYCIDNTEIIQCVQLRDVAYAAPNANRNGIHLELAGSASQSPDQWKDAYSLDVIDWSALLIAEVIVPKTHIPVKYLTSEQLRQGRVGQPVRGITTHLQVTRAYNTVGGHTDPGTNFPMTWLLDRIIHYMKRAGL